MPPIANVRMRRFVGRIVVGAAIGVAGAAAIVRRLFPDGRATKSGQAQAKTSHPDATIATAATSGSLARPKRATSSKKRRRSRTQPMPLDAVADVPSTRITTKKRLWLLDVPAGSCVGADRIKD